MKEIAEKLRSETGLGIMDCYKALERTNMNYEEAKKYLKSDDWRRGKYITYGYK